MEIKPTISRRSFLAAGAALGAMTALGGVSVLEERPALADEAKDDDVDDEAHVAARCAALPRPPAPPSAISRTAAGPTSRATPRPATTGDAVPRSLCPKGNSAMAIMYSPTRLEYPMKRVGEKGEGKFERITWDQAYDEIAQQLLEQKEQYGAKSYGVLSPQAYSVLMSVGRRFLNVHGSPNYLHSAICNSQRMFSNLVTLGGPAHMQCNKTMPGQLGKTKLLVNWGYSSENSAINQGDPCKRLDAIENGLQVIDIRPMRDWSRHPCRHAGSPCVPALTAPWPWHA